MHAQQNIVELSPAEQQAVAGGVAPVAIAIAVYTFFGPIVAAGVAVGVSEAVDANQ